MKKKRLFISCAVVVWDHMTLPMCGNELVAGKQGKRNTKSERKRKNKRQRKISLAYRKQKYAIISSTYKYKQESLKITHDEWCLCFVFFILLDVFVIRDALTASASLLMLISSLFLLTIFSLSLSSRQYRLFYVCNIS